MTLDPEDPMVENLNFDRDLEPIVLRRPPSDSQNFFIVFFRSEFIFQHSNTSMCTATCLWIWVHWNFDRLDYPNMNVCFAQANDR